jgi:hypothetical protein
MKNGGNLIGVAVEPIEGRGPVHQVMNVGVTQIAPFFRRVEIVDHRRQLAAAPELLHQIRADEARPPGYHHHARIHRSRNSAQPELRPPIKIDGIASSRLNRGPTGRERRANG